MIEGEQMALVVVVVVALVMALVHGTEPHPLFTPPPVFTPITQPKNFATP